jgi:hypothetical protein
MWISTRGVSQLWFQTRQNLERASELVKKNLHFFLLLPPLVSPKCGVDNDGLILESLHSSICLVEIQHVSLQVSNGNNGLNYES